MSIDYDLGALMGDRYEEVYDQNGNGVLTDCCGVYMVWDSQTGKYICPRCKDQISRQEFLDEYVEAYGPECYGCKTNYPQCIICHRGHQKDLDEREDRI